MHVYYASFIGRAYQLRPTFFSLPQYQLVFHVNGFLEDVAMLIFVGNYFVDFVQISKSLAMFFHMSMCL